MRPAKSFIATSVVILVTHCKNSDEVLITRSLSIAKRTILWELPSLATGYQTKGTLTEKSSIFPFYKLLFLEGHFIFLENSTHQSHDCSNIVRSQTGLTSTITVHCSLLSLIEGRKRQWHLTEQASHLSSHASLARQDLSHSHEVRVASLAFLKSA